MLKLSGNLNVFSVANTETRLLMVCEDPNYPLALQPNCCYVGTAIPEGTNFYAYIVKDPKPLTSEIEHKNVLAFSDWCSYLSHGDVIRINPGSGRLRSLYRTNSQTNSILLTERCDHYCLMCSQPPKSVDDTFLLEEAFDLIRLIPREARALGITGGEPTLYGEKLVELVKHIKTYLPAVSLDLLSNGRAFADENYARLLASVAHPDLMLAIPIYSSVPEIHNYVVQAENAFDETIKGIINLKRYQQKVQIRVVIHKQTVQTLMQTAQFIATSLRFVDEVALMGLEITGFTRANLDVLWIDPYEYRNLLRDVVQILTAYGVSARIFNHQLCVLHPEVLPFHVASISDWKNEYIEKCEKCVKRGVCGGFFSSNVQFRHSDHITPFVQ